MSGNIPHSLPGRGTDRRQKQEENTRGKNQLLCNTLKPQIAHTSNSGKAHTYTFSYKWSSALVVTHTHKNKKKRLWHIKKAQSYTLDHVYYMGVPSVNVARMHIVNHGINVDWKQHVWLRAKNKSAVINMSVSRSRGDVILDEISVCLCLD